MDLHQVRPGVPHIAQMVVDVQRVVSGHPARLCGDQRAEHLRVRDIDADDYIPVVADAVAHRIGLRDRQQHRRERIRAGDTGQLAEPS